MKQTQVDRVKQRLISNGFITRNECLRNRITRLAAIMDILKKRGWEYTAEDKDDDYIYTLITKPADTLWN